MAYSVAFESDSKVGQLISKMIERQKEIEDQKNQLISVYNSMKGDKDKERLLANASELSKLNAEEFGKILKQGEIQSEAEKDLYTQQNQLKMERERQRAEQ